jgi:hypothetical protein
MDWHGGTMRQTLFYEGSHVENVEQKGCGRGSQSSDPPQLGSVQALGLGAPRSRKRAFVRC